MSTQTEAHGQAAHVVRLEWGPTGAAAVALGADVAVVVDVLSFTTTLSAALERGTTVYPYPWRGDGAAEYAAARGATLARGRSVVGPGEVSLSPASVLAADGLERLVLPSPNGSSICFALREEGIEVVGGSLRNRSAVGRWLAHRLADGARVALVAAGERWPDGSLRPAVEDLWGAGAVLAAAMEHGARRADLSPEAEHAVTAFDAVRDRIEERLLVCASGKELVAGGFAGDVRLAGELDVADVVPLLSGDAFAS